MQYLCTFIVVHKVNKCVFRIPDVVLTFIVYNRSTKSGLAGAKTGLHDLALKSILAPAVGLKAPKLPVNFEIQFTVRPSNVHIETFLSLLDLIFNALLINVLSNSNSSESTVVKFFRMPWKCRSNLFMEGLKLQLCSRPTVNEIRPNHGDHGQNIHTAIYPTYSMPYFNPQMHHHCTD